MASQRGFAVVALVNPKTPANIGGVLRAAGCYGASLVVLGGPRPERLSRFATDTQKAWRHIPHILVCDVFDAIPYDAVPIAVDIIPGARELPRYTHPERAFYIFGAEDATLGAEITSRCRDVVYVPTYGCMNLAAAANVVLYDRLAKRGGLVQHAHTRGKMLNELRAAVDRVPAVSDRIGDRVAGEEDRAATPVARRRRA